MTLRVAGLRVNSLVRDVSFEIGAGERVGLIGESGSGKSVTALSIMGLLPEELRATGSVRLNGRELLGAPERARWFITHDLAVVAEMCERVLVMLDGEIVEAGTTREVLTAPKHAYTRKLLDASDLEARR